MNAAGNTRGADTSTCCIIRVGIARVRNVATMQPSDGSPINATCCYPCRTSTSCSHCRRSCDGWCAHTNASFWLCSAKQRLRHWRVFALTRNGSVDALERLQYCILGLGRLSGIHMCTCWSPVVLWPLTLERGLNHPGIASSSWCPSAL